MAKPPPETKAVIIAFGEGALTLLPAAYLSLTLYFACAPCLYYGPHRAWSESISAEPLGKGRITFSTGEIVSYGANIPLMVLTFLASILFLTLFASLFIPVLQATQLLLTRMAPNVAREMAAFGGPTFERGDPSSEDRIGEQVG